MTRPAPYQCGHCPCTFKKIGALNAHVSKFHTEFVDAKGRRSVQHKYTKTLAKTKDPIPQTSGEFILLDGGQDENVDPEAKTSSGHLESVPPPSKPEEKSPEGTSFCNVVIPAKKLTFSIPTDCIFSVFSQRTLEERWWQWGEVWFRGTGWPGPKDRSSQEAPCGCSDPFWRLQGPLVQLLWKELQEAVRFVPSPARPQRGTTIPVPSLPSVLLKQTNHVGTHEDTQVSQGPQDPALRKVLSMRDLRQSVPLQREPQASIHSYPRNETQFRWSV